MALLLSLGGLALFFVVRAALTRQFDDGLAARAAALQSLTRLDGGVVEMDIAGEVLPRYQAGKDAEFFVAWVREKDGWRVLERSESLRGGVWDGTAGEPPSPDASDSTLPDLRAGRSYTVEFRPLAENEAEGERDTGLGGNHAPTPGARGRSAAPVVRVLVAQSRESLDRTLATIALAIGGVGLALVLASLAATRWAVRRGTAALDTLSATVAGLGPQTLDQRVDAGALPDELAPVAERLNDLLARLEEAFEREKRFSAAASHELRTPIAELRTMLEVALSRPRSGQDWAETGEKALAVLARAQSLCEALLRLAREESQQRSDMPCSPIALAPILAEQAARTVALHGGDARRLRIECPPDLTARIDPEAIATIMGNLFDNALRHGDATPDRPAECFAHEEARDITITVRNHAPHLAPADVPRVFEPFWQGDASRTRRQGFGLGLSLARSIAFLNDADLRASTGTDGSLRVQLTFGAGSEHSSPRP